VKRFAYLDVLRALAVLLLVFFHATGYLLLRRETGDVGLAFRWVVHAFHMPLFFVLSGFVLGLAARKTGMAKQIRSRWRRLAVPFLVGMVTVIPALKIVNQIYISRKPETTGGGKAREAARIDFDTVFSWQPQHLWFLEYLFYLSAIVLAAWWAWRRYGLDQKVGPRARPLMLAALIALPVVTVLLDGGWEAAYQPDTMVPDVWLSLYYLCFLAAGWMLSGKDGYRQSLERAPGTKLLLGGALVFAAYSIWRDHAPDLPDELSAARIFVVVASLAACWLLISGLWGLSAKLFASPGPRLRLFAESSYWLYIVHLPILVLIESELARTSLPVVVRWLTAIALTTALCTLSYALFVKDKPLSRLLGEKPKPPSPLATVPGYVSKPSHATEPGSAGAGFRAGDGAGAPPPGTAPQTREQPVARPPDRDDREAGSGPVHRAPGLPDDHGRDRDVGDV
jgi:peptidoglycan/LPS O-acetylase OafA/YrhL